MKRILIAAAAFALSVAPALAITGDATTPEGWLLFLGLTAIGVLLYFLPAVIAFERGHQHRLPILLTNLFFGWTFIGWVAALIWSSMPVTKPAPIAGSMPPPLPPGLA